MGALIDRHYHFDWVITNGAGDRRKLETVLVEHFDKTMQIYTALNAG